jgi:CheY-like chemotaxis protein
MQQHKKNLLFVDDEQNILDGIRRNLGRIYNIHTAPSAKDGLALLEDQGPFAVVVSDMRMPNMDGIHFLSIVRDRWPDSVRVMLTGNADMETAIAAANEGNIFRFLTKPCSFETLEKVIEACLKQYRLVRAERELLENTLKASIQVLVDILSLANPVAFSRTMRIRNYIVQIAKALHLSNIWRYEVAAMLSQIGYITIPSDTIEKVLTGETLSESEKKMVDDHAEVGGDLIARIPRLEVIAEMISHQDRSYYVLDNTRSDNTEKAGIMGAALLKAAMDFDTHLLNGVTLDNTIELMVNQSERYHPSILNVLKDIHVPTYEKAVKLLEISELRNGMLLAENIKTKNGVLIVTSGQVVNNVLKKRLENFCGQGNIEKTVRVYVIQQPV